MSGSCLFNFSTGGIAMPGHSRCDEPIAVELIAGCVHEHGGTLPMCAGHAPSVIESFSRMECEACRRVDGHQCRPRLVTVRELDVVS